MITHHCYNDAGFYSGLCLFTFLRSLFVHVTLRCCLFVSPSGPMSIFYRIGFLIMNTFSFYLTWGYPPLFDWSIVDVHLPHSWESVPSDTGFLVDTVFTWDFDCVSPLSLAARVSGEKPAGDFIEDPCGWCCSGLWALSVFCLRRWPLKVWLSCVWCGSPGFNLCGVLCTSWIFIFTYLRLHCLFSHLESFSRYFFTLLGPFLCLLGRCVLWGCVCARARLMVPWVLQTDYFSSVLSFCSSVSIIFIVLFQVLCFFSGISAIWTFLRDSFYWFVFSFEWAIFPVSLCTLCVFSVVVVEQQTFESNNVITPKIRFSPLEFACFVFRF